MAGNSTIIRLSLLLVVLAITHISDAQNSPQDYVNAHNDARSQVGVGPIQWDQNLANYASNYLSQLQDSCQLVHSGGPYGENLAWGYPDLTGTAAVKLWVDEKPYYDYNSNSCVGGQECRHYTQVVWRDSVRLGCARLVCNNNRGTLVSCNYDPPGNIIGQRPYDNPLFEVPLSFPKSV
ncbi:hypothetical protein QN277_020079 [Acacia crassicarpa]|uniref:SCP domain-containing protein n=1 Tax=Acacia crassicarpa TaxID=499986 RepID=A0AAE1MSC9_9FABA|nr:hypothetical protein QN277_020079 [Acacia crassicarpa]